MRAYLMSWEGAPNFRWTKMHKGVRYRVTCDELGAPLYTAEESYQLANAWWRRKLSELTKPSPEVSLLTRYQVADLKEAIERGQAARQILAALPVGETVERETVEDVVGIGPVEDEARRVDLLAQVVGKMGGEPVEAGSTLRHHSEKWLAVLQGEMKPLSFRDIRKFVRSLYSGCPFLSGDTPIASIDESRVEGFWLWLKGLPIEGRTRKKRWGYFARFVRYLWSNRLIELPRNLASFRVKVSAKAVKVYETEAVREILKGSSPRLRLYALLALNCGMTSVDIGQLRKVMVDLNGFRLVRKRVKTETAADVPTVEYVLWPETVALLRKHWSKDDVLALTSRDGTPLWRVRQEGERTPHTDLIYQLWSYTRLPMPLKALRSVSATLIEGHREYGRCTTHFLGHSPRSLKEKHYAAPPRELFDECVLWLRGQILG